MKTKKMIIALLMNADLDKLCSLAPCSGMACRDCPFYSELERDAAVMELKGELDE